MNSIELLIDGLDFGEGPRWHNDRLWYSDFYQHRVYTVDINGNRETILDLGEEQPSGLGWLPNGDLLVVGMLKREVIRYNGNKTTIHASLKEIATWHCNDMVVSKKGIAYVGNFGYDYGEGGPGLLAKLALVRPDGAVEVAASDLNFPNGSVITPDEKKLIIGETFACKYSSFTIQADGTLSDRRIWAEIPGRLPDGCTLDSEGAIWFADAFTSQVVRVEEGGGITDVIDLPHRAFACMLGGLDGKTLYMFTAPSDPETGLLPGKGSIFVTDVSKPHAGLP